MYGNCMASLLKIVNELSHLVLQMNKYFIQRYVILDDDNATTSNEFERQ